MRLLKYIFNTLVWTILGLYLLLVISFEIPAVQRYAGKHVAAAIADKLATKVSIGKVDFGIPNRLILNNVLIHDQQGKEMVKARRVSAKIDLLPLAEGKISIATAQLFGADVRLYQTDSVSKPNFQFVLDSLASKDTTDTKPLYLRINSLIMRHSSVSYDRYDLPETLDRFNPQHLKVSDISAHLIVKMLTEDSVNINIKRLALKEKSGLQVDRLSMKFRGGKKHSLLEDFVLRMGDTNIQLGDIEASYLIRQKKLSIPSLYYRGSINNSTIKLSDLSCLLPSLKTFNDTLSLSSVIQGKGDNLVLQNLLVTSTTDDINIDIDGWVKHLTEQEPSWQANINDLKLSAKSVNFISENLKGKRLELPEAITRMGSVHLQGIVKGEGLGALDMRSQLNADIGNVSVNINIDKQRAFHGDINTDGINLGKLLDDSQFGMLATDISLEGRLPANGQPVVNAVGTIKAFDYNGYSYNNIDVNGSYSADGIIGKLTIDDPNIGLDVEGSIDRQSQANIVNLTATVKDFSPQAIHLSDKWGDARFSTHINANFTASDIIDAVGTVDISDFKMVSPTDYYQMEAMHVQSGYNEGIHFMRLNSDFGQAEITGDFDYKTLTSSFTNFLATTIPTLPGLPKVNPDTHNNFAIQATIHKSDWIEKLLQLPLHLTKPLTLQGTVNDNSRQITIECDVPQFFYKDSQYDKGHLSILSPIKTLLYDLSVVKLMDNGEQMELQTTGSAYNNMLSTSLIWDNHAADRMSGKITAQANFDTSFDNRQAVHVDIAPSHLLLGNAEWDILPSHITYSDKRIDIDNFALRHNQQHLLLSGTASESTQDSIFVDLSGVDIQYVLDLVNFHAVDFSGLATGTGNICGIFGQLRANGNLKVDQFKFENGRMGTLDAHVNWNTEKEQIDIHAIADDGPEAKTYIDGFVAPGPGPGYIDLGIRADGTYLDFALSFTSSFISQIDGHGKGAVHLIGPLDAINLTGELVLNGNAHVKTLGCTYEMRNDTLKLVPNEIMFAHCPIYDIHGNEGMMTGGIHHKDLTNLTYDIYVDTPQLMAYDFPDFGDELFYGTVYVQGRAGIHGRENEVIIEADVTPLKNSVFVYNASAPDVITNQEFIQWGTQNIWNTQSTQNIQNTQIIPTAPPSDFRSDLIMRLKVNATPDGTMRLLMDPNTGDYITLHGHGDLQATYYNKGGFTMFGTYEVTSGNYDVTIQNVIKKNFIFQEGGTIVFNGDPYDALLNLQAQHIVNGVSLSDLNVGQSFSNTVRVNCLMNITGQPRAPIVDFDLDIPNVNTEEKQMVRTLINGQEEMRQQVVYLLAVGRFYPQGTNNAAESENQRNNTSLAMQSLLSGTLSGQINNVLGQVIKSNNWNFGANISTGDEGWNNAEYEGIINGRLLNNRLLINGQFGYRDKATTATPSFIGDFDIRYLLFPNGNLAMKVYNQTNDRYFTRSSLNTQGIGIIMKKDFNGWRELLNISKKKKKVKN